MLDGVLPIATGLFVTTTGWLSLRLFMKNRLLNEAKARSDERTTELAAANDSLRAQIDERQAAERARCESEERIRLILDRALDAVIMMDGEGKITTWTGQAEAIFGWRREEVLGRALSAVIIPPQYREAHDLGVRHYLATGEGPVLNRRIEIHALHRNGREFPVELTVTPLPHNGRVWFSGFVRDISQRARTAQYLSAHHTVTRILAEAESIDSATEQILKTLCRALSWSMGNLWMVERQRNRMEWVRSWTAPALGAVDFKEYMRDHPFGKGEGIPGRVWATAKPVWIEDITRDPSLPRGPIASRIGLHASFAFPLMIADEVLGVMEFFTDRLAEPDAELLAMSATIGSQIGQFLERKREEEARRTCVIRDIIERKQAEEALRQAKEAAEAADRLKTEFLANISHEIRTPLNGIMGMTELALAAETSEERQDCLATIHASGQALHRIIENILDFSQIETGRIIISTAPFNPRTRLQQTVEARRTAAEGKGLALTLTLADDLPDCLIADHDHLHQLVDILLDNAIKFTVRGGIDVRADIRPAPAGTGIPGAPAVSSDTMVHWLHIAVMDTGIGIPEDKLSFIFDAFMQVDGSSTRRYGGAGLGLAIVEKLSRKMGGRVTVESLVGRGTTFHIHLPCCIGKVIDAVPEMEPHRPAETPVPPISSPVSPRAPLSILVAEDDPVNQQVVAHMLAKCGDVVVVTATGNEMLRALERRPFDAVLMDVQMPGVNGLEATQRIRRQEQAGLLPSRPEHQAGRCEHSRHRMPIIAITAHAMPGDRERCLEAGMDDYLSKPVSMHELIAAIDRAVRPACCADSSDGGE